METVGISEFVKRQHEGSGKTFSPTLSFEEIANHAQQQMAEGHFNKGYRDGVRLVHVSDELISHFVCPLVKIDETTKLNVEWTHRQEGENPYIRVSAENGIPLKAGRVELVLYRYDVLAETDEQSTDAEWELISINAVPEGVDHLPMKPVTMMRNQLQLPGGTSAHYTSEEWAEAIKFWQKFVPID
tara:strand:- start:27540 stop:28097 length:558 start_codon:yes stop_codon:yes gene_type:complete